MGEQPDTREWPEVERRSVDPPPAGAPRRRTEDRTASTIRDIERRLDEHESDARTWRSAHDARLELVEGLRALLDGSAGNDMGLIGTLGEVRGGQRELAARMDRQAAALEAVRADVREIKRTASTIDGNTTPPPPKSHWQALVDVLVRIVLPILLVLIPVLGTIIVGYLQLKGQLIQVQTPGGGAP